MKEIPLRFVFDLATPIKAKQVRNNKIEQNKLQ